MGYTSCSAFPSLALKSLHSRGAVFWSGAFPPLLLSFLAGRDLVIILIAFLDEVPVPLSRISAFPTLPPVSASCIFRIFCIRVALSVLCAGYSDSDSDSYLDSRLVCFVKFWPRFCIFHGSRCNLFVLVFFRPRSSILLRICSPSLPPCSFCLI